MSLVLIEAATATPPSRAPLNSSIQALDLFTSTGYLITALSDHTATLLNTGLVLFAGYFSSSGLLSSADFYNPTTGAFTSAGNLITVRFFHSSVLLQSGIVLIIGGSNATVLSSPNSISEPRAFASAHLKPSKACLTAVKRDKPSLIR